MATDPEFTMQGIVHVIAAPGGDHHPLLFRLRDPTGKPVQVQAVLHSKFTVFDVIAELHLLANNLRLLVAETDPTIDFPAAVAGDSVLTRKPPSQST
jgi:hypothetical protein